MAKVKHIKGSGVSIDVSWLGPEVVEKFIELAVEELEPVAASMEARARELCPVGTHERFSPGATRPTAVGRIKVNSKKGYINRRDYRNTRPVNMTALGDKWRSRTPGRLRASVRSSVYVRRDGSAILLFLEAGDKDAFYASYVELGTYKMKPQPYLRPAFTEHLSRVNRAVWNALNRLERIAI